MSGVTVMVLVWFAVGLIIAWLMRNEPFIETRRDQLGLVILGPMYAPILLALVLAMAYKKAKDAPSLDEWLDRPAFGRKEQ